MYTTNTFNNNPLIENSFLGSDLLKAEYLFSKGVQFLSYIFNAKTLGGFYVFLSFLAILFIAIIIYTTIRMFEIRAKERAHLKHEIAEYTHNQALREKELQGTEIFKNERWKKVLDYLFSLYEQIFQEFGYI